ncbi:hypothetical protein Tco_0672878 [Tanacetum coccineum]
MGDEVVSTTPERENDEFIKSSVDDLVPISREFEVTSDMAVVVVFGGGGVVAAGVMMLSGEGSGGVVGMTAVNVAECIVESATCSGKTKDGLKCFDWICLMLAVKPELFAMQDEDKTTYLSSFGQPKGSEVIGLIHDYHMLMQEF